jgi:hypothetical protein
MTDQCGRRYAWQKSSLFRIMASTPLAIGLLVAVVLVLAGGTIVGARTSLSVALHTVYGAVWFQVLLGALAANLICCTLKAMPYRWSHVGFVVTHSSLLLIFAGAILTINFGAQGEVFIAEGGETGFYFDGAVVRCTELSSGTSADISTSFEATADRLKERFDGTVRAGTDALPGVRVLIERYYPDATAFGTPEIHVAIPAQGVDVRIPAIAEPEARIPITGTKYTLTIAQLFDDRKDRTQAGGPESALNPAARVVLHGPDGDSDLVLFARPQSSSTGDQRAPEGVSLGYDYPPQSPRMRDWQVRDSAIRITLRDSAGQEATGWIRRYERREIALGSRSVAVEYPERVALGATLRLDQFVAKEYPHSRIPAAYESRLTVRSRNGSQRKATVAMNAPVTIQGYVLYQSSFGRDPETGQVFTVLSLSRDPGTPVLYAGFGVLITGLIVTFYVSPQLRRREQARRTEAL